MDIISFAHVVNLALAGVLCGLAALSYSRNAQKSIIYIAIGGLIILVQQIILFAGTFESAIWSGAFEAAALFMWMSAIAALSNSNRASISIRAGSLCVLLILASILYMAASNVSSPHHIALISLLEITLILFAFYFVAAPDNLGMHYITQTFVFFALAAALTGIAALTGPETFNILLPSHIARSFGLFSISLFVANAYNSPIAIQSKSDISVKDAYFTASHAFRQIDDLPEHLDRKEIMSKGMALIASALREIQGFNYIFHSKIEDNIEPVFKDCLVGSSQGIVSTQLRLPESVIQELKERPLPILISDISKDSHLRGKSFEQLGVKAMAIIPLTSGGRLERILVLGAAPGLERALLPDIEAVEMIASFMSIVYSHLQLRCEMSTMPDMDATTLLRNFSSFNKRLSSALDDSDRNGATLALVFIDIDHFSTVNKECGFERGDQLLRELGAELAEFAGPDNIGRIGADEFAFILPNALEDTRDSLEDMLKNINARMCDISGDIPVTVSAAYSIYPFDFFDRTGVFSRMREMLSVGRTANSRLVRVKVC